MDASAPRQPDGKPDFSGVFYLALPGVGSAATADYVAAPEFFDPKAYLRPWTVTLTQIAAPDTELLDYHCMERENAGRLAGR